MKRTIFNILGVLNVYTWWLLCGAGCLYVFSTIGNILPILVLFIIWCACTLIGLIKPILYVIYRGVRFLGYCQLSVKIHDIFERFDSFFEIW